MFSVGLKGGAEVFGAVLAVCIYIPPIPIAQFKRGVIPFRAGRCECLATGAKDAIRKN